MLKLPVLVVFIFTLTDTTIGYSCSCYCSYGDTYLGSTDSSSCSNSSCNIACSYYIYSCSLWSTVYGTCTNTDTDTDGDFVDNLYSGVLGVGKIIGIVIASFIGIAVLICIIVLVITYQKRKRARIWAVQAQQQQQQQQPMVQPSFINVPGQQWPHSSYPYPPTDPMNNFNPQYPLTHPSIQPVKV